ncbi:unnamed protein product [Amoebophrya sp. A120]|nr:unnamed protein product [Amoebophrya sp. A120]|eukprot:GSA120T00022812001.1
MIKAIRCSPVENICLSFLRGVCCSSGFLVHNPRTPCYISRSGSAYSYLQLHRHGALRFFFSPRIVIPATEDLSLGVVFAYASALLYMIETVFLFTETEVRCA